MARAISYNGQQILEMLTKPTVIGSFEKVSGDNAAGVIASIETLITNDTRLQECEPNSVIAAAGQAAILHLPLYPTLGCVYLIPFDDNGVLRAQFNIGTRGWTQLALRTHAYRRLNHNTLYDGEVSDINVKTGEVKIGERIGDNIIGYIAHYELTDGFQKDLYMTREDMENHAYTYSDTYRADVDNGTKISVWSKAFNRMAEQTVLKLLLKRFGYIANDEAGAILSVAFQADQSVVSKNNFKYVDNDRHTAPRHTPPLSDEYINKPMIQADDEIPPWEKEMDSDTGEVTNFFNN